MESLTKRPPRAASYTLGVQFSVMEEPTMMLS